MLVPQIPMSVTGVRPDELARHIAEMYRLSVAAKLEEEPVR